MMSRTLIAFMLLICWPFAGQAPAHSPGHAPAATTHPVLSLWLDPRTLPAATDAAAEIEVFEQTLARSVELFLPLSPDSAAAIHRAAAAFADRRPVLLTVDRFEAGNPVIEFIPDTVLPITTVAVIPHRDWSAAQRGCDVGATCLELFIDVDALRREFLDSFASGRAGRIIHALGVPNARSLAFHGRWIPPDKVPLIDPALPAPPAARRIGEYAAAKGPPLIRLDLSWNSRSDQPTIIRGINIAAGHCPIAQLKLSPPAAPFLCLFRANFRVWLANALMIRAAWLDPELAAAYEQSCAMWLRANRPAIDRISGSLSSWMLLYPSSKHANLLFTESPLRGETTKPAAIVHEFDQLVRTQFPDHIERIPDGASRFPSPENWPASVIFWNPSPATPPSTVQLRILLCGGD